MSTNQQDVAPGKLVQADSREMPRPVTDSSGTKSPGPPKLKSQRKGRKLLTLAIVALVFYLLRAPILSCAPCGLLVADTVRPADWALLLGGDRCFDEAAVLYNDGTVKGVLLIETVPGRLARLGIRPTEAEIARRELVKRHVPEIAIETVPGEAKSDWEAARVLQSWASERSDSSFIVLCSRFAGRELCLVYSKVSGTLSDRMAWHPLKDRRYDESNWWHRKEGVLDVFNSYLSLVYFWVNGEQPSTWREWDAEQWLKELTDGNGAVRSRRNETRTGRRSIPTRTVQQDSCHAQQEDFVRT